MKKEEIIFSKPELVEDVTILDAKISTFRYNLHAHDDYAIGMTLQGDQCFECNGKDYISRAGSIIQFNPEEPHNGHAGDDSELTYKMIYIGRTVVDDILIDTKNDLRFSETVTDNPKVVKAFINLSTELNENAIIAEHSDIVTDFIYKLIEYNDLSETSFKGIGKNDFVTAAIYYIYQNIDSKFEIDDICRRIGVSKYHFIRSFKKITNRTPYQYILDLKMEWVRKELEAGLEPIIIADKFGFHDLSHLINRFKRTYGITPLQYQKHVLCPGKLK